MIRLLTVDEQKDVTEKQVKFLEGHILVMLGFDTNFPNPIPPMERYLRLLNYDQIIVKDMSF